MIIKKFVSGGQTGVDSAALDVAIEFCIPCGGWAPKGLTNEYKKDIDPKYNLKETPDEAVEQRTEWNVRDSDATLIIYRGKLTGGTASYKCRFFKKSVTRQCVAVN
jgi:Circularly permutated YpsA SLOG family